ncbi:hypothetical protein BKA64DRAFT_728174 [Cadophora sp. MPI-SDFR-AT-0126]|nr:hypothetical protein BKA64DRAFT_728174 [Leotiomycetes sp. MPI-SDFR-AT-0126]
MAITPPVTKMNLANRFLPTYATLFIATKCITESIYNRLLRNRTNVVSITAIVGVSLTLLAVILRFLSRMKSRKPGIDDWTMIIAIGFMIPLSAIAIILVANHGLGKDIWSVPFENITHVLYEASVAGSSQFDVSRFGGGFRF